MLWLIELQRLSKYKKVRLSFLVATTACIYALIRLRVLYECVTCLTGVRQGPEVGLSVAGGTPRLLYGWCNPCQLV